MEDVNLLEQDSIDQPEVPGTDSEQTWDWTKDERFKGDTGVLAKSYRELEQEFSRRSGKLSEYEKQLQEYEQLKGQYTDLDKVSTWFNENPDRTTKLEKLVQGIMEEEMKAQYGANLPTEVLDRLKYVDSLQQAVERYQMDEQTKALSSEIQKGVVSCDELAKKYGIEWNADAFLQKCHQEEIPPRLYTAYFKELAEPMIVEKLKVQHQESVLKNLDKNKQGAITSRQGKVSNAPVDLDFSAQIKNALRQA